MLAHADARYCFTICVCSCVRHIVILCLNDAHIVKLFDHLIGIILVFFKSHGRHMAVVWDPLRGGVKHTRGGKKFFSTEVAVYHRNCTR